LVKRTNYISSEDEYVITEDGRCKLTEDVEIQPGSVNCINVEPLGVITSGDVVFIQHQQTEEENIYGKDLNGPIPNIQIQEEITNCRNPYYRMEENEDYQEN